MSQDYRLHDLRLRATGDHPAVRQLLHRALHYKGAETSSSSGDADATLDFRMDWTPTLPSAKARRVSTSEPFGIEIWKTTDRMILSHEDATVNLCPRTGVAQAAIASDLLDVGSNQLDNSLLPYLVAHSLAILLRHCGWFPLHAAGLVRNGRGVLLTARSGSGKSTAALSLVRSGWAYLSDDTVLLRPEDDQVQAYSFRRNFHVDPSMATHFPELNGPDWPSSLGDSSKWQIDMDRIYPGQSVPSCIPRLVVLPEISDTPKSSIEPVDTKPVLEQLISQGAFFLTSSPDTAERHLTVLRRLIGQSHTYRLHAGRDALNEPRTIHKLLAEPLREAPACEAE